MTILRIQFPDDFEERYLVYKAKIYDNSQETPTNKNINTISYPIKKYSDIKEPIKIGTLGIEISGNYIVKGKEQSEINDTDKWLVYFLYFKFVANKDECFETHRLVTEMESEIGKKTEEYIKNRISFINKTVRELVVKGKTNIGDFIKHAKGRGYHLNSKIVI